MLSDTCGKRYNKYVSDYVVFDLETTGISPKKDEVVEISAVKVINGEITEEYSTLVNPGIPIPSRASSVNGIYDEMVKDAPSFDTALKGFLDFAGDMILVGHNIHLFDMKIISRDSHKYFGQTVGNDYIDTLYFARMILPELAHHTLADLACHYDIDTTGAHRALNDCRMNQKIFEYLGEAFNNSSGAGKNVKVCPVCGNIMKLRNGKFGEFWGCKGFPLCRYTENK